MSGMSGQEIYDNFHAGQGAGRLAAAADLVRELAAEFDEETESIRQLMRTMESVWRGDAAGAAYRGAGPMVIEHAMAVPALNAAQELAHRQAEAFDDARNSVVPVPPQPVAPQPWALLATPAEPTTFDQQAAAHNAAAQHNVDVMTAYTEACRANTAGLPTGYGSAGSGQERLDAGQPVDTPAPRRPMDEAVPGRGDPALAQGHGAGASREYLAAGDAERVFGTDEVTTTPVIGVE